MVSGIKTNEEVLSVYKLLKNDRKLKALTIKINDQTILEVEKQFERKGFNYDDFLNAFPSDDSRFGVIDFNYTTEDGRPQEKILFILWSPINAKPLKKMKYSTSVNAIVDGLGAIALTIQADSISDITRESLEQKVSDKFH